LYYAPPLACRNDCQEIDYPEKIFHSLLNNFSFHIPRNIDTHTIQDRRRYIHYL
jgi:hypothetical protein